MPTEGRYLCRGIPGGDYCGTWHSGWHRFPDTQDFYRSDRCAEHSIGQAEARREADQRCRREGAARRAELVALAATDQEARTALDNDARARAAVGLPERGSDAERAQEAQQRKDHAELERHLVSTGQLKPRAVRRSVPSGERR